MSKGKGDLTGVECVVAFYKSKLDARNAHTAIFLVHHAAWQDIVDNWAVFHELI